jgi:oligoendopeptidase F
MSRITNHSDRAVREAGYRTGLRGRNLHRGSYARILRENVVSRNALAQLRGFRDFREESYGQRFLTTEEVARTLREVAALGQVNKRYERARIEHLRATYGLDSVHVWDLALPEAGMRTPRFTVPEASELLRRSHEPLGPDYARELNLLLDPRNGRLDLEPREGRSPRPGFSTGSVGFPSVFFQGRYEGYLGDVVIFAHEIGHGVQNGLMDANGVLSTNAGGPAYFTESFAGFTELLLTDYLYRTATGRSEKIFYLQAFLDRATALFDNARTADFEHTLYDSIPAGWAVDADALDRLTRSVGSRYSIWYEDSDERKDQWNNSILYFTRPLYSLNYTYSTLLALKYFADFQRDRAAFVERYDALLANGYDDEPGALLRRFVGIDLQGRELVPDAVRVIESRLAELERLYAGP